MTIEELEQQAIHGNAHQDLALWSACDNFILDEQNPMSKRIRALAIINRIVGIKTPACARGVNEHIAFIKEMVGDEN